VYFTYQKCSYRRLKIAEVCFKIMKTLAVEHATWLKKKKKLKNKTELISLLYRKQHAYLQSQDKVLSKLIIVQKMLAVKEAINNVRQWYTRRGTSEGRCLTEAFMAG